MKTYPMKHIQRMLRYWQHQHALATDNRGKPTNAAASGDFAPPPIVDFTRPPTLELLTWWAKSRGYTDEKFIRQWFEWMSNELFWCYPKTGTPLRQWTSYFGKCYRRRNDCGLDVAASDTPRMAIKHADNWRGTRKEDIGNVLG